MNVPSYYLFTSYSTFAYDEVIGIAINGVPIYPGRNKELYDYMSPKAYGSNNSPQKSNIDVCLGEIDGNLYHYRGYAPCMFDNVLDYISLMCTDELTCVKGYPLYLNGFDTYKTTLTPIRIAREGRKIYGPRNSQG